MRHPYIGSSCIMDLTRHPAAASPLQNLTDRTAGNLFHGLIVLIQMETESFSFILKG